jgi:hypothetical protein
MAKQPGPSPHVLAHRRADAARALSISIRMLDELTAAGTIPHIRIGARVVLYPISALEKWLADESRKEARSS